ncbi:unnamed protein product, partial [Tetraodon nigroviridis]
VVCPLTCLNGGVCLSRKSCHCPPGFTGRLCQFPLTQTQQAQAARGNKQPVYPMSMKPDSLKLVGETSIGRTQMTQTHSVFTLPLSQGPHAPEVPFNVRVHHPPDTSVVIYPLDQSDIKLPHKSSPRIFFTRHKPKGRCFQETTPKQACNSTPLPVLTNQEDCCGSVGNSWGQNKCYQCPKLPNAPVKQTIVEDSGTTCPQGYKRFNDTHCQDINECIMQVVCQNGDCLNTLGSFKCSCKAGWVLEGNGCVGEYLAHFCPTGGSSCTKRSPVVCPSEAPAEQGQCFLMASESRGCEHALPTYLTQDMCCCTVGKAWGPHCQPCPQIGTVAFSKICPAGKGYFYKERREIFAFPPIVYRKPDQDVKKALGGKLSPCVVNMQIIMLYSHQTLSNSSVSIGPTVVKTTPHQVTIIRLTPDNVPFETQTKVSDVDECKLNRNICGHGECESSLNGYVCHCHHGYHLNQIRNICEDNNECELEPCGHGRGHCVNTDGSFKCLCRQGYKHMVQQGRPKCIGEPSWVSWSWFSGSRPMLDCACAFWCADLNECSKQDICGVRGQCINLPGSYKCECHGGFRIKSHRNPICEDVNECLNPDACPGELCENTVGSYECVPCLPGHEARGGTCFGERAGVNKAWIPQVPSCNPYNKPILTFFSPDINECLKPGMCPNGHCENLPGTYRCLCNEGFLPSSDSKGCSDINECEDFRLCANGRCINTEGSFQCQCYSGFQRTQEGSHCEGTNHSASGACMRPIRNINECERPSNCLRGRCINSMGSYHCECQKGYVLVGGRRCQGQPASVTSTVTKSHQRLNLHLEPLNLIFKCALFIRCRYFWTFLHQCCRQVFGRLWHRALERKSFLPLSRCSDCTRHRRKPVFVCLTDVDECAADRNLCQPYGTCENRPGSYSCVCNHGYTLSENKRSCEAIRVFVEEKKECYLNLDDTVFCDSVLATNVTKQECCCSIGVGWGDHCEIYPCPVSQSGTFPANESTGATRRVHSTMDNSFARKKVDPLLILGCLFHAAEFHSLCPNGLGLYYDEGLMYSLPAYHDIDECALFAEEICKRGHCENTLPGYECYCKKGFYYDSNLLECTDVNECHDESLCAHGHCINTEGSFFCSCNQPWIPDANKKKCVLATVIDVNECEDPANCKNGRCVDTPGSYYCICAPPWTLATDRNSCVTPEEQADVNECQDPSYCKNGRCENTPGSFHCFCDPPLTFSAALKQCVYDDRTAAHKDVCFLHVDEGLICSQPKNDMVVTYSQCCCHYGRGWGPECNTCPPRHSDMFNRLCQMHLETESDGEQDSMAVFANYNPESFWNSSPTPLVSDVFSPAGDSSEEDSDECSCANGRCVRSYLGTMCECNTGFRLDYSRTRCLDIDECTEPGAGASPCKNSQCVNTAGSYKCFCKHGFVPARRPNICVHRRTR